MGLDSIVVQDFLVALLVLGALSFSVWKLMPARRRLRVLLALDAWSARHPSLTRWRERSLKPRIVRAGGVGCDGCAAHSMPVTKHQRSPR